MQRALSKVMSFICNKKDGGNNILHLTDYLLTREKSGESEEDALFAFGSVHYLFTKHLVHMY
jgi:hypothetical protein